MTSNDGVATRTSTVASTSNIGNIMAFTDINKIIDEMNSKGVLTNNKEVVDEETAAAVDATVAVDAQEEGHEPESERGRRLVVDNNADSKNDDDDDNGTSTPEDDVMYYEDYPTLYFAIRRGRYTNNNSIVNINADADCGVGAGRICYNWDEAKHELHNYHSAEYIATPTLLQATRYIHRLGEFKNNHDNDNIDIDNEIDNVCEDSDNGANNNDNENDSNATAATTTDDDDDDNNDNNTVTISSSSSSSMVHHHRRSKSKKKKMGKKKKKKKKDGSKKKESIDTTTTTAIIPTIKKTKELLMEFYKLYDPHDTATTTTTTNMMTSDTGDGSGIHEKEEEHHNKNANKNKRRLSMDTFLQEKNMYERKYERMVRHWTRSGLVIMRNENVSIDVAFMKYDIWIEERQEEKIANTNTACRTTNQLLQDDDGDNDDQEKQTNKEREEEDHCDEEDAPMIFTKRPASYDDNNSDDDGSGRSPPRKKRKTSVAGLAQVATLFEKTSAAATTTNMANGDSDDDEAWDEMYRELKKFYQEHKHCKVDPMNDRIIQSKTESGVEKSLQCWVAYQHRRMRPQKEQRQGGAAKFLTIREERLLNKLEFIPNYDKITKHLNQYIRRRIAKAFPIPADYINPTTNVTRQIYFGTVDRIASITNQVRSGSYCMYLYCTSLYRARMNGFVVLLV